MDLNNAAQNQTKKTGIKLPVRNLVTIQILKVTSAIYFVVTLTVTLIHMRAEYLHMKQEITIELKAMQETFEPVMTQALWRIDQRQWESTIEGMMKSPVLIGVKLEDKGKLLFFRGLILDGEKKIASHKPKGNLSTENKKPAYTNLFEHSFVMSYAQVPVGRITLYSSNTVVFQKVKVGFMFIVLNAIIKTGALWILFIWVGYRLLNRPLSDLTTAVENFSLNDMENFKIDIGSSRRNELKVLEEAFNSMIGKLFHAIREQKKSEATFQAIVEHVPVMIDSFDENGKYVILNKEARNQLGYTLEELNESENPLELIYSVEQASEIQKFIDRKDGVFRTFYPVVKDGSQKIQEWADFALPDGSGVSIGVDITDRIKIEEQLRQSFKMEAIGSFSGGIAHDFNNILSILLGNIEMAGDDAPEGSSVKDFLKEAETACLRAGGLVRQILKFSRKTLPEREPVSIVPIIEESIRLLRSAIPATISIEQNLQPIPLTSSLSTRIFFISIFNFPLFSIA